MAYWVKINYERNNYVINFERVSAFCYEQNGRIKFWLPDSALPIVINPANNLDDYRKILDYIQIVTDHNCQVYWVKIYYERSDYIINLNRISCFCYETNGRITFWIPDCSIPIVLNPQGNPESYQKILDYVQKSTGYSLT